MIEILIFSLQKCIRKYRLRNGGHFVSASIFSIDLDLPGELGQYHRCPCLQPYSLCRRAVNTLRPRQNGRHFADDMFRCIFLNENVWIPIEISLTFVPNVPINNIPALVQIMAWRRPGDKPLSEPMMVVLPTHIWVTRPQWVNSYGIHHAG